MNSFIVFKQLGKDIELLFLKQLCAEEIVYKTLIDKNVPSKFMLTLQIINSKPCVSSEKR